MRHAKRVWSTRKEAEIYDTGSVARGWNKIYSTIHNVRSRTLSAPREMVVNIEADRTVSRAPYCGVGFFVPSIGIWNTTDPWRFFPRPVYQSRSNFKLLSWKKKNIYDYWEKKKKGKSVLFVWCSRCESSPYSNTIHHQGAPSFRDFNRGDKLLCIPLPINLLFYWRPRVFGLRIF